MKYIGIVGSRRRNTNEDFKKVFDWALGTSISPLEEITFVSGGCKDGADSFVPIISKYTGIPFIEILPDKSKLDEELLKKVPRAAHAKINYARNELIAKKSDVLIACVAEDRKGGAENTIKYFLKKLGMKEKEAVEKGLLILC